MVSCINLSRTHFGDGGFIPRHSLLWCSGPLEGRCCRRLWSGCPGQRAGRNLFFTTQSYYFTMSDLQVRLSSGDKYRIPRIADHLAHPLFMRKQAIGDSATGLPFHSLSTRQIYLVPPQLCSAWGVLALFKHWASLWGWEVLGGRFFLFPIGLHLAYSGSMLVFPACLDVRRSIALSKVVGRRMFWSHILVYWLPRGLPLARHGPPLLPSTSVQHQWFSRTCTPNTVA